MKSKKNLLGFGVESLRISDVKAGEDEDTEPIMDCKSKTIEFVAFCFEQYKRRHHLDTDQVMDLFEKYDVFSYLQEGYEPLHTQDAAYLMEDIEEFIRNRQEKK